MASIQEQIDELNAARLALLQGRTARVSVGGVTREFISLKDLNEAIGQLKGEAAAATGKSQRAQIRFE